MHNVYVEGVVMLGESRAERAGSVDSPVTSLLLFSFAQGVWR